MKKKALIKRKTGYGKAKIRVHRRAILKSIAGGSAAVTMLKDWQTPVVQNVVLPAHAQTTTDPFTPSPDVFIDNLQVVGPNSDACGSFSTPTDTIFGGCQTVQYSFDFGGFTGFTETNLSVVGPLAGPSSEIFNMTYTRGMGSDNGNTHSVVANGIPFAIPGDYDFTVTASDDGTGMLNFIISSAWAAKKKSAKKKAKRKVK